MLVIKLAGLILMATLWLPSHLLAPPNPPQFSTVYTSATDSISVPRGENLPDCCPNRNSLARVLVAPPLLEGRLLSIPSAPAEPPVWVAGRRLAADFIREWPFVRGLAFPVRAPARLA